MKKLVIILAIFLSLLFPLACGHHHHGGGSVSPPSTPLVKPTGAVSLGTIKENVTDVCLWGNTVFFSPYLRGRGKVYILDLTTKKIHVESIGTGKVESVYRIWVHGGSVYAGTEQPPMFLKRGWKILQKYASHGWAVCGNEASDGTSWRGWAYYHQGAKLYRNNVPFPGIPGRIVWWVEFYRGIYYAGTSGTTSYKNANDGRIYVWRNNRWEPLPLGPIGSPICLMTVGNALYVGTGHPQSILRFNGVHWGRWDFNATEEVSKFWSDSQGRVFTATTEGGKIHVRQYYKGQWPVIWEIAGHSTKWGPQGVCVPGGMIVSFRDGNITRVWEIKE